MSPDTLLEEPGSIDIAIPAIVKAILIAKLDADKTLSVVLIAPDSTIRLRWVWSLEENA